MGVYVSKNVVYNEDLIAAAVAAFKTVPGAALMVTPKLRLFTNAFQPIPATPLGTFVEANFSGYTAPTVVLNGPVNLSQNASAMVVTALFLATVATPFVDNTLAGWYLTDATATLWYASERFTSVFPIASAGDYLEITLAFPLPFMLPTFP